MSALERDRERPCPLAIPPLKQKTGLRLNDPNKIDVFDELDHAANMG
jgi:hypothetical protein